MKDTIHYALHRRDLWGKERYEVRFRNLTKAQAEELILLAGDFGQGVERTNPGRDNDA